MLFPTLLGAAFERIDLDAAARAWHARHGIDASSPNPLLDPTICGRMVLEAGRAMGAEYTYGGWLEDRSRLWRGSYLDENGTHLHLGMDFNVPAGTPVALEYPATVLLVDSDVPEEGGWGTRVIVRPVGAGEAVVYAHLDTDVACRVGEILPAGTRFAAVGRPPENGGWFPHLHVQRIEARHFARLWAGGLGSLDGYGPVSSVDVLRRRFPDPLRRVFSEGSRRVSRQVLPVPAVVC